MEVSCCNGNILLRRLISICSTWLPLEECKEIAICNRFEIGKSKVADGQ